MIHVTAEQRDEVDWSDPEVWAIDYPFTNSAEYAAAYLEASERAEATGRPWHIVLFDGLAMVEFLDVPGSALRPVH